jgi:hypothetical protein
MLITQVHQRSQAALISPISVQQQAAAACRVRAHCWAPTRAVTINWKMIVLQDRMAFRAELLFMQTYMIHWATSRHDVRG